MPWGWCQPQTIAREAPARMGISGASMGSGDIVWRPEWEGACDGSYRALLTGFRAAGTARRVTK